MPTARGFAAGAVVGGKLYVLGGWNPDVGPPTLSIIESYAPKSDAWSQEATMPLPRIYAGAASLDGIVYIVGGCDPAACYLSSVEAYDPKTTAWTLRAPMPTGRNDLATAVAGGKLYAIGGVTPNGLSAIVEVYNPKTNEWAERAPMPSARHDFAVATVGGIIYVFGGEDLRSSPSGRPRTVLAYNPETDTWTTRAPMPTERTYLAAAVVDGVVYAIGGYGDLGDETQFLPIVEAYDPKTDSWGTEPPIPTPRQALVAGAIDDTIYVVGGQASDPLRRTIVYLNVNEAFSPFEMVSIDIKPGDRTNTINLGSRGVVPVAILGSATFDPMTVDPTTVILTAATDNGSGAPGGAHVASRGRGVPMTGQSDVNGDGYPDLILYFRTQDMTALQPSPAPDSRVPNPESQRVAEAVLYGTTYSSQRIRGSDNVRIVPTGRQVGFVHVPRPRRH